MSVTSYELLAHFGRSAVVILLILGGGLLLAPTSLAQASDGSDETPMSPAPLDGESAWDYLKRQQPEVLSGRAITPLERKILQILSPRQADAYLSGDDPDSMPGGQKLADFIVRIEREEAAGLVYRPIAPCLLADSRRAQGRLAANETRTLFVRGPEADLTFQGGDTAGCGFPGLTDDGLRSSTVHTLALDIELLDAEGHGEFRMWAANEQPRPPTALFSYGSVEPQAASTYRVIFVPVCSKESPAPCRAGDLKMQASGAGAHVAISALGYFQVAQVPEDLTDLWAHNGDDIDDTNLGKVGDEASISPGEVGSQRLGTSLLTVAGIVESTTGGFKFPDGTVQTSAGGVGPNSVGSAEVIDNSLTSSDLGPSSVGSSEMVNGSVTYSDIGWPLAGTMESLGVEVQNSSGATRANTYVSSDTGTGVSATYGPNGSFNVALTRLSGASNNGYVATYDSTNNLRAGMYVDSPGDGTIVTYGSNGNLNVLLGAGSSTPDHGGLAVHDASGNPRAGIFINSSGFGAMFAEIKSFRVSNPDDPETDIWYASLEGPEAAAYVRGTGHLVGGRAVIGLPTHFRAIASPVGLTVSVTPLSAESKGLAVVEKSVDGMVIRELAGGDGSYGFDYTITAVRRGHEGFRVIRPAGEGLPANGVGEAAAMDGGT